MVIPMWILEAFPDQNLGLVRQWVAVRYDYPEWVWVIFFVWNDFFRPYRKYFREFSNFSWKIFTCKISKIFACGGLKIGLKSSFGSISIKFSLNRVRRARFFFWEGGVEKNRFTKTNKKHWTASRKHTKRQLFLMVSPTLIKCSTKKWAHSTRFFGLDFYDFGCRNAILINGACFQTPKNFPGATAPGTPLREKG